MLRIVLADDDLDFRGWLRSLLDGSGDLRVVAEASTGTEAIDLAETLKPDVMIADVHMPGLDGLDVARHLRYQLPGIKVLLVSANSRSIYAQLAEDEGALGFIPKRDFCPRAVQQVLQMAG